MKKMILAVVVAVFGLTALAAVVPRSVVYAENEFTKKACAEADEDQKAALGCDEDAQAPSVAKNLLNVAISLIGIIAVIVIVFAGQRYITAQGDPGQLQQAKNMILYGIIGVIVASLAFAIVNFVLSSVFASGS
ncbi:hypothetical protein IKF40_01550 [Candidatus Saccharibacteria bacterium]|nr:hypothetical protein [Candidatus Saccharibacteria bacterium]MBR2989598.1 hypothetical protein [Candidatus Saccharibacteria bacterium]